MPFTLPALIRAKGTRRREITLRPVNPASGLEKDLAAIFAPAWQVWREGMEAILAGYDPAPLPTGDSLTLDSPAQIESAINAVAADFLTRLVTQVTPALRRWVVRAEAIQRNRWVASVRAGTGIDLGTVLTAQPVQETLEAWLARNVALVRNISDQAQSRISDAVWRGYQNRTPAREVAKELAEAVGMGRKRAVRVAADQNAKLSAALDDERRAEAGIAQYRWRHSGKRHPREEHKARDGQIFENGKPSSDTPGQAPWCGCRAQAYIPLMDEIE